MINNHHNGGTRMGLAARTLTHTHTHGSFTPRCPYPRRKYPFVQYPAAGRAHPALVLATTPTFTSSSPPYWSHPVFVTCPSRVCHVWYVMLLGESP